MAPVPIRGEHQPEQVDLHITDHSKQYAVYDRQETTESISTRLPSHQSWVAISVAEARGQHSQMQLTGLVWQTDRPTDHASRSVTIDRIYVYVVRAAWSNNNFIVNLLLRLLVKEFGKSVRIWWNYGQKYYWLFLTHAVYYVTHSIRLSWRFDGMRWIGWIGRTTTMYWVQPTDSPNNNASALKSQPYCVRPVSLCRASLKSSK